MAYSKQKEVNAVAKNIFDIVDLLSDNVPDAQQYTSLLAEAATIIAGITSGLSGVQADKAKARFIAEVGVAVERKALAKLLPEEEV